MKGRLREAWRSLRSEGGGQGPEQRPASPSLPRLAPAWAAQPRPRPLCSPPPAQPLGAMGSVLSSLLWKPGCGDSAGAGGLGSRPPRACPAAPALRAACSYLDCVTSGTSQTWERGRLGAGHCRGWAAGKPGLPSPRGGGPRIPRAGSTPGTSLKEGPPLRAPGLWLHR